MQTLCKIRDIQRAVHEFEMHFEKRYGISLNEGMVLCSLKNEEPLSSGRLCELLGLTASNTSKVIRNVEKKGLVVRVLGEEDRRQMYFSLSEKGRNLIENLRCGEVEIPLGLNALLPD